MGRNKSKQARRAEQWAKDRKMINWDVVWKVLASVFAFAGSMVAVYELVNYFRSDAKTFYSIIFPGLGMIVWLVILFQLFRKQNSYAIPLLAVTLLGGVVGGIGLRSYNQTQEDKVVVLVARFDGPEDTYGLRRQIIEDLQAASKGYDDTLIVEGEELVTSSERARELGAKEKADLVIWAWYRPTENPNITIHFENLSPTDFEAIRVSATYQPQATLAQLESFEVQRQIGSETSTLISFMAGMLRYKSGDYPAAIERFEQVLQENDISTFVDQADLNFSLGNSNINLGNYDRSIQNFDAAIEINPQYVDAYINRGNTYNIFGRVELAIIDYDRAIDIDPQNTMAFYNRGLAYFSLKQYERAIQDFDKVIEADPQDAEAYMNRGVAYDDFGQFERAIQDYDKAIEINSQLETAFYNRGIAYADLGQYERAIQDYDKAIEIDPEYTNAYINRGLAYFNLEKYERGIQDYDKAIEIDPNNAHAYINRGVLYFQLKQYDRAIQDYDKAIEIDPEYPDEYKNRGLAYQELGKTAEAEADFKKYEELTGQKP